jgi:hypothetical protein
MSLKKIGKDHYRLLVSTFDKNKAEYIAKQQRKEGKLIRVLKKTHKYSWGKETTYYVWYNLSSGRKRGSK